MRHCQGVVVLIEREYTSFEANLSRKQCSSIPRSCESRWGEMKLACHLDVVEFARSRHADNIEDIWGKIAFICSTWASHHAALHFMICQITRDSQLTIKIWPFFLDASGSKIRKIQLQSPLGLKLYKILSLLFFFRSMPSVFHGWRRMCRVKFSNFHIPKSSGSVGGGFFISRGDAVWSRQKEKPRKVESVTVKKKKNGFFSHLLFFRLFVRLLPSHQQQPTLEN